MRETGYTRPHTVHCMPGDNIVISMLGDPEGNGAGGFVDLDAKTFEIKGRWENGGTHRSSTTTSGTSRARTCSLVASSASRTPTRRASTSRTSAPGRYGQRIHFWDLGSGGCSRRSTSARRGSCRSRCAGCTTPRPSEGFVGAALSSVMWRFARENGSWAAQPVIEVEPSSRRAGRSRSRADHRPRPLDGRPLPLLRQLAARRRAAVRRLRPGEPKADRPGVARRRDRPPVDGGLDVNGGPKMLQLSSTAGGCTSPTRCTRPGTTSSIPTCVPTCCAIDCDPTAAWRSTAASSSTSATGRAGPHARTRCACSTATARRRSSSDPGTSPGSRSRRRWRSLRSGACSWRLGAVTASAARLAAQRPRRRAAASSRPSSRRRGSPPAPPGTRAAKARRLTCR